jgi:hypothetical protein
MVTHSPRQLDSAFLRLATRSFFEQGLWILPDLCKTHRPRFAQVLGRRGRTRRPQAPQALIVNADQDKNKTGEQ